MKRPVFCIRQLTEIGARENSPAYFGDNGKRGQHSISDSMISGDVYRGRHTLLFLQKSKCRKAKADSISWCKQPARMSLLRSPASEALA